MYTQSYQDERALRFFNESVGLSLNPQNTRLTESDFFFTANLKNGAGTIELTFESDTKEYGIRNFNHGKLPVGEHVAWQFINFGIDSDSAATNAGVANYVSATTGVPAEILNAELIFNQNDKTLVPPIRIGDLLADQVPQSLNYEKVYNFKTDKYIEADSFIKVMVRFPQGASLAAVPFSDKNYYIRIHFGGAKLVRKVA